MRLITIVLTVLIFSGACGRKVPENVVPQQQMGAVLLDMHLADGQLAAMVADSARMYRDAYYDAIFNRYGIDSAMFERSIEFYSTRPALMKKLYTGIEKQLEAYNAAEQREITEEYTAQRKADSLANARRTDSLRKITRDSLDVKRKRYLLYRDGPDSIRYGQPIPVTHALLRERLMEAIGLPDSDGAAAPSDTLRPQPDESPLPSMPNAETPFRSAPTSIKKIN